MVSATLSSLRGAHLVLRNAWLPFWEEGVALWQGPEWPSFFGVERELPNFGNTIFIYSDHSISGILLPYLGILYHSFLKRLSFTILDSWSHIVPLSPQCTQALALEAHRCSLNCCICTSSLPLYVITIFLLIILLIYTPFPLPQPPVLATMFQAALQGPIHCMILLLGRPSRCILHQAKFEMSPITLSLHWFHTKKHRPKHNIYLCAAHGNVWCCTFHLGTFNHHHFNFCLQVFQQIRHWCRWPWQQQCWQHLQLWWSHDHQCKSSTDFAGGKQLLLYVHTITDSWCSFSTIET